MWPLKSIRKWLNVNESAQGNKKGEQKEEKKEESPKTNESDQDNKKSEQKEEKKEESPIAVLEQYEQFFEKSYRLGGFTLTVFGSAIFIIVVSIVLSTTVAVIENLFPYLMLLAIVLVIIGTIIYLFEINFKGRMIQRSLDRSHEFNTIIFSKYLEKKHEISEPDLKELFKDVSKMTREYSKAINELLHTPIAKPPGAKK